MFGRNMWLRKFDDAVALTRKVHAIVARYPGLGAGDMRDWDRRIG